MGPGWRANATIGRAIRLILINVGGAIPGHVSKSLHGMPGRYTFCFGEDEEGNPWEPLHVERGFKREESAVTVIGAQATHNVLCSYPFSSTFLKLTANAMCTMGNNNMILASGEPMVVFTSGQADILVKDGFNKRDVKRLLFEHARVPLAEYPPEMKGEGSPGHPLRLVDGMILPCASADDIMIVVAGAPNTGHIVAIPTFGDTRAVTKRIVTRS